VDELIDRFNGAGIRYLLMGGQAMRLEGMPRFSMDWDFFIPPRDLENIKKINILLKDELDLPLVALGEKGEHFIQTYQTRWGIIQFHLGGPGLPRFEPAESRAVYRETENGIRVRCLSTEDLLQSKKAANRPQDQGDIAFLERKKEAGFY
jgi:hypothetical protein